LATVLHVPITILLVGIVLRGSAFVFRSYGRTEPRIVGRWGLVFSIASVVTPLCFGIVIGAISSDAVGKAANNVATSTSWDVHSWPGASCSVFAVGSFALPLFAMLAAVYLAHAATANALRDDYRRRALVAVVIVAIVGAAVLVQSESSAPRVAQGVTASSWAFVLHACTAIATIAVVGALWVRRYRAARVAAAAQVTFILW